MKIVKNSYLFLEAPRSRYGLFNLDLKFYYIKYHKRYKLLLLLIFIMIYSNYWTYDQRNTVIMV